MPAAPRRKAQLDQRAIIEAAQKAARKIRGPLTLREFKRLTGITLRQINSVFPAGLWSEVVRRAGIERCGGVSWTDGELLSEYHRVASAIGDIPGWTLFDSRARVSSRTVSAHFDGLKGTLARYQAWLSEHDPASTLLSKVSARLEGREGRAWPRKPGAEYGEPINFGGLRHAPINEQGVIHLFGMVYERLGFVVEAIHPSFPDCEAKRALHGRGGRWQFVRIEFEYRSKSFVAHGHDPAGCDMIVCWEHDWDDCPLEVIELRKVITDLPASRQ